MKLCDSERVDVDRALMQELLRKIPWICVMQEVSLDYHNCPF